MRLRDSVVGGSFGALSGAVAGGGSALLRLIGEGRIVHPSRSRKLRNVRSLMPSIALSSASGVTPAS